MKKVLFLDRDGTLVYEPEDYQLDALNKLEFLPMLFRYLGKIVRELDYELVMVTNQDGLGSPSFPESDFWPIQNFIIKTLEGEGIRFSEVVIDRTFAKDQAETRKPRTGLLTSYLDPERYDLKNSVVVGDRLTDMELAKNLGAQGILLAGHEHLGSEELESPQNDLNYVTVAHWEEIYTKLSERKIQLVRNTSETQIDLELNLDGTGKSQIDTGIKFFDHMLDQLSRHGQMDLKLKVQGDLEVDEHHTIEDTAIALGEAFRKALGSKLGIERYGFTLPMDDALAQVALDFGGRNWLVWEAEFHREMIGQMPTEMFYHFFKSFSDGARANLNIKASGDNEHHKIEAIFKAFAKSIKAAVKRDPEKMILPTTKGVL